jgi:hypothetical protein
MKLDSKSLKAMLASYGRSFLAAATAVYATGNADVKSIIIAALASTLPVALRAVNPKDPAFGVVAKVVEDFLVKEAAKAPAKKAAKTK